MFCITGSANFTFDPRHVVSKQCGSLTCADPDEHAKPPFKSTKLQTPPGQQPNSPRAPKGPAKAPIGLRVFAGRSETSLVAHTTLLGISCRGSFLCHLDYRGPSHFLVHKVYTPSTLGVCRGVSYKS